MQKKKPYGVSLKEKLSASARDRLYNFLLADGAVRGVIIHGTQMVNEMRTNHELGVLETLVLGRAYLGAGLMSADLKSDDRISLKFDCSGPIKGLVVEANAFGEVRGFLKQVPIPVDKPLESFDLTSFFGAGFVSEKINHRNTLLISAIGSPLIMWMFIHTSGILMIFSLVLMGMVLLASGPIILAIVQETNTQRPAFTNSIFMTISFGVTSLMVILVGVLGDIYGLEITYKICMALATLAIPFVFFLPKKKDK